MAEERVKRRLAAILAADVVGYSRLMEQDEAGTLARLMSLRAEIIDPKIAEHGGRIVKTMGDGVLVEFGSAVAAVENALAIQVAVSERELDNAEDNRIQFRVGVNLGDVIIDGNDIHGDGVNVAARLEGLCVPGAVCISGTVHEHVSGKIAAQFEDLGEQRVKNISRPVRAYRVSSKSTTPLYAGHASTPLPLPSKPSIAVLPFTNISGDPEQEYFSDGISEDIITALSRIRWLFVVARNSTFSYKGRVPDVRDVAQELGVRYVLEGSVRKSSNRVRISAQLIDGTSGNHIWAERYDRELEDVFAVQDELALTLCGTIEPELTKTEQQRVLSKAPGNMKAWDYYQRGMWLVQSLNKEKIVEASSQFERAIELDPNFSRAYVGYVGAYSHDKRLGFHAIDRDKALHAARRSVELDNEDAGSHWALGLVYYVDPDPEAAIPEFEQAIWLNPSFADAHSLLGSALLNAGRADEAIPWLEQALRLSPRDPFIGITLARMGVAFLCRKQHEDAVEWCRRGLRHPNIGWPANAYLVSALGHLGRHEEARQALDELNRRNPGITVEYVKKHSTVNDTTYLDHILDGLKKAGLPENKKETDAPLPLPDKPSIAVLPFENMSGDPEQEYFADGIAEDIITALSRFHWFFVIARNSSFTYKGGAVDVKQVAEDLGVQYVLEGSVRKVGGRVRITAQLIDGTTGNHVWAERYDRELEDIFAVQDEITSAIAGAVAPSFVTAEAKRIERKVPDNLRAWDYAIHGNWHLWQLNKAHLAEARKLFEAAINLDPKNVLALSGLALTSSWEVVWGWAEDPDAARELADTMAQRAVAADEHDAWAHASLSHVNLHRRRLGEALRAGHRALELNPNLAVAEHCLAAASAWGGDYEAAHQHTDRAERLSPRDPAHAWFILNRVVAAFVVGRYEEQVEWAEKMTEAAPDHPAGWRLLTAGYGLLDRPVEARKAVQGLLRVLPHYTIELARSSTTGIQDKDLERLLDGLRKAGVPEN